MSPLRVFLMELVDVPVGEIARFLDPFRNQPANSVGATDGSIFSPSGQFERFGAWFNYWLDG